MQSLRGKAGISGPRSTKPMLVKEGCSMGVRRMSESGVELVDDVDDSDVLWLRHMGV